MYSATVSLANLQKHWACDGVASTDLDHESIANAPSSHGTLMQPKLKAWENNQHRTRPMAVCVYAMTMATYSTTFDAELTRPAKLQ